MSEPKSSSWSVEKFQEAFKSLYDVVASAATRTIKSKFSEKISGIDQLVFPWDESKIDMHFKDPESDQSGTVCALKIFDIPYSIFEPAIDSNISSSDGYIAAIMNIFINPVVNACKDAFEEKKDENARIYVEHGSEKDSHVILYIIYNGEVSEESVLRFTTEDFNNLEFSENPEVNYEFFGFGKKSYDEGYISIESKDKVDVPKSTHESNTISTESVTTAGFIMEIKGQHTVSGPNDFMSILQKKGIEKIVGEYIKEYVKWGWAPITQTEYNLNKKTASIDMNFKSFKSQIGGSKIYAKATHTFQEVSIKNHSCVMGVAHIVYTEGNKEAFQLDGLWLRFFNKQKNKIIHVKVARSNRIPSNSTTTEGFFSPKPFDYGLSCNPSEIKQNKFTFPIDPSTGQVRVGCDSKGSQVEALLTPFVSHGIDGHVVAIYKEFMKLSPDWDAAYWKDIDKNFDGTFKAVTSNFFGFDVLNKWTDKAGNKYTECWRYKPIQWILGVICIVELFSIRPDGYDPEERHPTEVSNIFMVMYNTATHGFATPMIASNGYRFRPTFQPSGGKDSLVNGLIASKNAASLKSISKTERFAKNDKFLAAKVPTQFNRSIKDFIDTPKVKASVTESTDLVKDLQAAQGKLMSVFKHESSEFTSNMRFISIERKPAGNNFILCSKSSVSLESGNGLFNRSEPKNNSVIQNNLTKILNQIADESAFIEELEYDAKTGQIIAKLKA